MLKNKKILFVFLFIILFFLFLNSKAFATFNIIDNSGNITSLPDLPSFITDSTHFMITNYNNGEKYILYFTQSGGFDKFIVDGSKYNIVNTDGFNPSRFYADTTGDSWSDYRSWYDLSPVSKNNILYATDDVINKSDNSVFFRKTPPQPRLLAQVVEESRPEKTLEEIINLLPLIIVVVVSLVGLRKGLALLLQILHKA